MKRIFQRTAGRAHTPFTVMRATAKADVSISSRLKMPNVREGLIPMGAEHWAWLGAGVLSILSAIVLIGNASDKIVKFWKALKAPNEDVRKELDEMKEWRESLEEEGPMKEWRKNVDARLTENNTAVKTANGAYHVLFQSLLALLDHGIDGNNIEQMENAKKAVQNYLIDK